MIRRALSLVLAIGLVALILAAFSIAFILYQPTRDGTAAAGATPGASAGVGHGSEVVALPIRQVNAMTAESAPPQVSVAVTGYVPDSCTKPREPVVQRNGQTIVVTIDADRETGVMCAQVATPYQKQVALGSFQPGSYTLILNGRTQTIEVR